MSTSGNGSRHYTVKLHHISEALIASGYTTLDDQAKALGINRSTAWTIIKTKHKLGRLSTKTTERILANPATPAAQLWTPPRHQNIAMRWLKLTMGDPQIVKLILAVLAVGMVVGFVAGYAVRAAISHHRHVMARRGRVIGGR